MPAKFNIVTSMAKMHQHLPDPQDRFVDPLAGLPLVASDRLPRRLRV